MKIVVARWLGLGPLVLALVQCGGGDEQRACSDIIGDASGAIQDTQRHADRTCAQDRDCFIFDFSISCTQQCTSGLSAAAIAAESRLEIENAALDKQYCTQLARPDCKTYLEDNIPSCDPGLGPREAICLNGKCEQCVKDQCLLLDEMQICTRAGSELRDCQSLQARP